MLILSKYWLSNLPKSIVIRQLLIVSLTHDVSTVRQLALIVSHCVYVTGMLSQSSKMSVIFGKLSRLLPLLKHPVVYSGIQNSNEK